MHMKLASVLLAGASVCSAHTIFTYLEIDGVTGASGEAIREPGSNSPVQDVTSDDIACNAIVTSSTVVKDVTAGSTVEAIWRHSDSDVIDSSHVGPVIAYMKKVDDAATTVGAGDGWFKISEAGLVDANGGVSPQVWAVNDLIDANGSQSITIPTCIEDGQYLLRAEIIALHGAGSSGGAQFYMECAQINVSGGTSVQTPSTVSFPGAYSATDPGILVNIYYPLLTNYTIPGPDVFTCDGSSGATTTAAAAADESVAVSSAAATTAAASTAVASVSSYVASATSSAAATSAAVQTEAASSSAAAPTTLQTSTIAATTAAETTASETTSAPVASSTSSATTMPEGTTLADLLSWLNQIINQMLS